MARTSKVLTDSMSRPEATGVLDHYAWIERQEAHINALMQRKYEKIRSEWQPQLDKLKEQKEEAFEKLKQYALEHRDEFGDKKSLGFKRGIIGFRTGQPKLKLLRGFKWESVTGLLLKRLPDYVRTINEPAKDKLIADRNHPTVQENLTKVGLQVVQDETFYVEPKKADA